MLERTSLILEIYMGKPADWSTIRSALVAGIPPEGILASHFTLLSHVPEMAELSISSQDTLQGTLITYSLLASLYRESTALQSAATDLAIFYVTLLNGETRLLGTEDNPMQYSYEIPSGMSISDTNHIAMTASGQYPTTISP